jgi:hypothetical protein
VIGLRKVETPGSVNVEFNEYVPLTITWSGSNELLEPPRYVELHGVNVYLELKFHPSSGILVEVVLAAASEIQVEQASLSPSNSNDANLMPFIYSGDTVRETGEPPVVKAYSDYLCVSFGPDPDHWVGSDPVLFGVAGEQCLAAICARWTSSERESVLAGRLELSLHTRPAAKDRRRYAAERGRASVTATTESDTFRSIQVASWASVSGRCAARSCGCRRSA